MNNTTSPAPSTLTLELDEQTIHALMINYVNRAGMLIKKYTETLDPECIRAAHHAREGWESLRSELAQLRDRQTRIDMRA